MKIFYAVQATGNGHISRAMEILPWLEQHGKVDVFLSGANSTLPADLPVKFRSKGLSFFYTQRGGLDYAKTVAAFAPIRIVREIRDLPVEKYDLVINDFECITSMACAFKKIRSVNFGHQASFISSKTPRPEKKDGLGEFVLRNYAKATQYVGLHFKSYDNFILPPIIKAEVRRAQPNDEGYVTVYLPSFGDQVVASYLHQLKDFRFEVFSKEVKREYRSENILFIPVQKDRFNRSLISCTGIITNAGFETPAEAMYLGKRLLAIPICGQYEQACNAAALDRLGVTTIDKFSQDFIRIFNAWIAGKPIAGVVAQSSTESIVNFMMEHCTDSYHDNLAYPRLNLN